jgi:hypothetical protein
MKTNVVLKSEIDRNLFGVTIRQETKTGFLNLSDLSEAYTQARVKNGWAEKNIDRIMNDNIETIFYLLEKQGVIKLQMCSFIESVNNQGFAKYMKSIGAYRTTGARHTKTTWVNPYIFVMVAMDLNPLFKANVIGWLTDQLIINRIEAGNFCKALNASIQKFNPDGSNYITLAKALNYIVFNRHETGIRNTGTKEQLKKLANIEEKMAFAVDMGYITSFNMLIDELRKLWSSEPRSQSVLLSECVTNQE